MTSPPEHHQEEKPPPLILFHCFPIFKLSVLPLLQTKYTILDQHANPPDPSFITRSKLARVLLCISPTPLTAADLDDYPAVECVISSSVGVNHLDMAACRRRCIRVTCAGDAFSDDVADYAVGLAIDVMRKVSAANRFVRAGSWLAGEYMLGSKVSGKRVGILGVGSIGTRIAKRFEAFGCNVAYYSRKKKPHIPYPYYANAVDLALNIDILIVCCALTEETYHVVNNRVMTALGKMGVIVNVGRGALIDENKLVRFLVRGDIGGAGLEVFEHEPNVPEELWSLDNVVLSPHKSYLTHESSGALNDLIVSNLEAFFLNKPLQAEVELD